MTQRAFDFGRPTPATCGPCVHRNGPPEAEQAGCAVAGADRGRDAPSCSFAFGRQQLNGPVYGHSKGRTWPEIIRDAANG